MPIETKEKFEEANLIIEYKKVKIGKTGERSPTKLEAPIITESLKKPGQVNFPEDVDIMDAIRSKHRINTSLDSAKSGGKLKVGNIPGVPVFMVTDNIFDAMHVYRGYYRKSGVLCSSKLGNEHAKRWFETAPHVKNKTLVMLDQPYDYACSSESCHLWDHKDCGWRAVVSFQLQDSLRFPSIVRYRTSGWYVIQALISSLRAISEKTNGVLQGIPLMLRKYEMKVKQGDKDRLIPIMIFEFDGTIQDLRMHALEELRSRKLLRDAHTDVFGTAPAPIAKPVSWTSHVDDDDAPASAGETLAKETGDELEDMEGLFGADAPASAGVDLTKPEVPAMDDATANEMMARIGMLAVDTLGYTPKRLELLIDKHDGHLHGVIEELEREAGSKAPKEKEVEVKKDGNWASGEAGDVIEEKEEEDIVPPAGDEPKTHESWFE